MKVARSCNVYVWTKTTKTNTDRIFNNFRLSSFRDRSKNNIVSERRGLRKEKIFFYETDGNKWRKEARPLFQQVY